MLILAYDTTSEIGGVGIFREAECLALIRNEGPANRYSITLFEMVERAMATAHLELREIELYAAANGPGSFTGIRVGLAAARAWGKAFDRRARGVSVLDAMVNKARPTSDWVFPILDARRGEFFVSGFRRILLEAGRASDVAPGFSPERAALKGGALSEVTEAAGTKYEAVDQGWVLKPEKLRTFVEDQLAGGGRATCLFRTHDQATANLRASLPTFLSWHEVEGTLVDSIADIALKEDQLSEPCENAKLEAYYIRRPDAELNWKD